MAAMRNDFAGQRSGRRRRAQNGQNQSLLDILNDTNMDKAARVKRIFNSIMCEKKKKKMEYQTCTHSHEYR